MVGKTELPTFEHNGIVWKLYHNTLLPDAPPHRIVNISEEDCSYLLKTTNAYLIRWSSCFDIPTSTSFWYIIKDDTPTLEDLSANTRNQVRRGLNRCKAIPTSPQAILEEGYPVYYKAFQRYKTYVTPLSQEEFTTWIAKMARQPAWEFWSVRDSAGTLIAYSQNKVQDNSCDYATIKFDPQHLNLYPSYALFFEMNRHYLIDRKLSYVNDGARSIGHATNIQDFLVKKFKFRKAYSNLHVFYNPMVGMAVRTLHPFRSMIAKLPGQKIRKINTLLCQEEIRRSFL